MLRKITIVSTLAIAISCSHNDKIEIGVDEEIKETKAIMDGVYDSFKQVIPFMYMNEKNGQKTLSNKKSKEKLLNNLNDIQDYFADASHVEFFQKPGFRPSLEVVHNHLKDSINSIETDNFGFAQKKLKALTGICISCHTQLTGTVGDNFTKNVGKFKIKDFDTKLSYANYLYLMRNFSEAKDVYNQVIDESIKKNDRKSQLEALRRLISIPTKVEFSFKEADSLIDSTYAKVGISVEAKELLESWKVQLQKWKDFSSENYKDLDKFVNKYLSKLDTAKNQDISYLVSLGHISIMLAKNNLKSKTPQALYHMAISEKALSETYFYSLSDLYLKDCIVQWPTSKYAKLCYNQYEKNLEYGYTGSLGTDIPEAELQELRRLKSLIE